MTSCKRLAEARIKNHCYSEHVNPSVVRTTVWNLDSEKITTGDDLVACEEPLAIQLGFQSGSAREQRELAVTMRTPGQDLALTLGFLFSEGIIRHSSDVISIRHCTQGTPTHSFGRSENLVKVELADECPVPKHVFKRHSFVSSSCGICGKASIDSVRVHVPPRNLSVDADAEWRVSRDVILSLPNTLREGQRVFGATGGLHAVGLFNLHGDLLSLHEDVGRHNALDKILGDALTREQIPLENHLLLLSGRASFELLQKAAMARIQIVCAVGAPSSLAIECAYEFGITLVGFLRANRFNVYSHPRRISELEPWISRNHPGTENN
jgi:FdhD protein